MAGEELVWLVDDDAAIRELLSYMVGQAGYQVEAFASGAEVLASSDPPPSPAARRASGQNKASATGV